MHLYACFDVFFVVRGIASAMGGETIAFSFQKEVR